MSKENTFSLPDPALLEVHDVRDDCYTQGSSYPILVFDPVVNTDNLQTYSLTTSIVWLLHTDHTNIVTKSNSPKNPPKTINWFLYEACLRAKAHAGQISSSSVMSIAIDGNQLAHDDFVPSIKKALLATDLAPHNIELAFAETTIVQASESLKRRLHNLQQFGVGLAISHFGATYASFRYFEDFTFSTVTLDASFARKLATPLRQPHYPMAIVQGLLTIANDLEFVVVASGIEKLSDMQLFQSLGCSFQQGSLFRSSLDSQGAKAWLDSVSLETMALTNGFMN